MKAPERLFLPDVQSMPDHRAIAIDRNHSACAAIEHDKRAA